MSYDILVLNPGSTSTKAAVYRDQQPLMTRSMVHTNPDLAPYPALNGQLDYRVGMVRSWLALENYDLSRLSAVVGRGGIIPNIISGGYLVDEALADCLLHHTVFDHASNLGGLMAREFALPLSILQIAKGVGTMLACFTGLIDAVILTGGLANSQKLTGMVIDYLHNLCRVVVIPGENEMEALALGALRILSGEEKAHQFHPVCPVVNGKS